MPCSEGSETVASLYEQQANALQRHLRPLLPDAADAEDAVQAAFLSALESMPGRLQPRQRRRWLYRAACNEAYDLLRRSRRETELSRVPTNLTAPSAEEQELARVSFAQLTSDLCALSERRRHALLLQAACGHSHKEIAGKLRTTPTATRQAISEARQALDAMRRGRAMECGQARRQLTGDRRSCQSHALRAHVRSCNRCSSAAESPLLLPD